MTYSRYIIAIILIFISSNVNADWTSQSVSDALSGSFCVNPASSHPNLNSKLVSIELPSSYDTDGGWVNGGVTTVEGKALFLKWGLSPDQKKYKAMFTAYGSEQSLYIAEEYGGSYKWIGEVPNSSNTDNGFDVNFQHKLKIPNGYIVNAKQISREEFLINGPYSPYKAENPSIGNGFFAGGFDNKLLHIEKDCGISNLRHHSGVNFNPNISNDIINFYTGHHAFLDGEYTSQIKFKLSDLSKVLSFKLLNTDVDDHILIKLNGKTIYWSSKYFSNNTSPAKTNSPSNIVEDIVINGSQVNYLDSNNNLLFGGALDSQSKIDNIASPVDIKNFLVSGENTIDIKLLVGGVGDVLGNFEIITASCPNLNSTSYPDCTSTNNTNTCIFQNGAGISVNTQGNITPNKSALQIFPEYKGNRIFEFQNNADADLTITYPGSLAGNFGLFGHYFFEINSAPLYNVSNFDPQLIYKICPTSGSCVGASEVYVSDRNYKADAYASGTIFFKMIDLNNPNPQGTGHIQVQAYNGTSQYSDFIYDNVILKIQTKLSDSSRILYESAILNPSTKVTYQVLMSLYIMLYGIYFLLGVVQVRVEDLVTRVIKIVILTQLFTETSWEFFNNYFFQLFTGGMNQLIHAVTGLSSNNSNLFGFIDPFMEKLSNPQFWAALLSQMVSFHNGLVVIGLISFFAVLTFLIGAFEIIIAYLLSVMGLSVMICMTPLFLVMLLFQPTRSLFDSWVSVLFSNAIQPTITLLLFLVVEQMFETYISRSVLGACMGTYIPINLYVDFSWIYSGWNFTVPLPFFPGIPFLIPENNSSPDLLTSSIIAFTFGKISMNLADFSVQVSSALSAVMPASAGGKHQHASNLISSIRDDVAGKAVR